MNRRISRISCLLVLAGLFAFAIEFAQANSVSRLSGSYQVIEKTDQGSQIHVRLQLRLANHGQSDLYIQRISLWGSSHPNVRAMKACSLVLNFGTSASTTQEFTVPRSEYRSWSGGTLRLLLAVKSPEGRTTTEVVRLDRISGGKAN